MYYRKEVRATHDRKNASPLLYRLQSGPENCATPKMKSSRVLPSQEYVDIAVPLVLGILHDGVQLLDFRNEFWIIF